MTPQCQQAVADIGNGVGASLRGIDCMAGDMTAAAFGRLFGSQGALVPALSIVLALFIGFFAIALITGRTQISIRALVPRIVTIGLVVTLTTSWIAYQSVVWNLAAGAPDQIASIILGGKGSATQQFGDKIDIVFSAIQQLSTQGGAQAEGGAQEISTFSPEGLMWIGATLLLLGTVGVLVTSRIALAVLLAVGPVFVVFALFPGTRGLFAGWLRSLVMMAVTPLFAVLGGTLMLEIAIPVINALAVEPGKIAPQAAMAFFLVGAVHVALMLMMLKVGSTMVGNWTVFGMSGGSRSNNDSAPAPAPMAPPMVIEQAPLTASAAAASAPRRLAVAGVTAGVAANDVSAAGSRTVINQTASYAAGGGQQAALSSSTSRVRGVGNRFRSPSTAKLARSSERLS